MQITFMIFEQFINAHIKIFIYPILKEVRLMDIAALSSVMSQTALMDQVSTAVLSKSLDNMEVMGDGMKKILETSVQPQLGQNFDVSI